MQLKTVGESINVLESINDAFNAVDTSGGKNKILILQELRKATSSYSTEAIKMALVESNLNETQIKAILSKKGLKGEILETTAAEIAEKAATKSVAAAHAGATGTTTGLTTAFKGLRTVLMQNPFLIVAAGVTVAMAAFNAFKQHQEELAQATYFTIHIYIFSRPSTYISALSRKKNTIS